MTTSDELEPPAGKSRRGFASMDRDKQRAIARRGGVVAHERGNAHEFTADEAREAGRKGGLAVSSDRQRMAEIGRLGGKKRAENARRRAEEAKASETQPEAVAP